LGEGEGTWQDRVALGIPEPSVQTLERGRWKATASEERRRRFEWIKKGADGRTISLIRVPIKRLKYTRQGTEEVPTP